MVNAVVSLIVPTQGACLFPGHSLRECNWANILLEFYKFILTFEANIALMCGWLVNRTKRAKTNSAFNGRILKLMRERSRRWF